MKWIDRSEPKFLNYQLWHENKHKVTIQKTRGLRHRWYGWVAAGGHKFGPFKGKADAKRWAEMAFPS